MTTRSRALVVTRNLPPTLGGMERLVGTMIAELAEAYDVDVVGPRGSAEYLPAGVTGHEVPTRPLARFLTVATWRSIRIAITRKPDFVLAGSGLVAPCAYAAARLTGARAIVYLHGLDVEVDSSAYRRLWWPIFRHCDRVIANSHHTASLAREAKVSQQSLAILKPGVSIPEVLPDGSAFRERYGLVSAPLMLYVGRITRRKGLGEFVTQILPRIIRLRFKHSPKTINGVRSVSDYGASSSEKRNRLGGCCATRNVLLLQQAALESPSCYLLDFVHFLCEIRLKFLEKVPI